MPGHTAVSENGKFDLFHNELAGTSNTILAMSNEHNALYHTLDAPNFLYTTDQKICYTVETWFKQIRSNSIFDKYSFW